MDRLTQAFRTRRRLWLAAAVAAIAATVIGYALWGFPFVFLLGVGVYAVVFIFTDWCPSCAIWGLMTRLKRAAVAVGREFRSASRS